MKLLLVRHGEPNYDYVRDRNFIGHGIDLAPLSFEGKHHITHVAKDSRFEEAELILSSPYTRALQTAAILNRNLNLEIQVETDLHEWMPDKTFTYKSKMDLAVSLKDFYQHRGKYPDKEVKKWETIEELQNRVVAVINKYYGKYETVIIVCHSMVMKSISFKRKLGYGEILEVDYHPDHSLRQWVFEK